ncbi:MAG: TIGR03749 family integrating conjugative element protein [Proteobacteria bacterium]|nr:TIGR03749 family integrating conjugative element protein [Pseudomonadota bacterium]
MSTGSTFGAWTLAAGLALLAALASETSRGTEVIRWQRLPITVPLHVGQERILFLDRPMRVAVPNAIVERLRVQSADGALYLRATGAFEPTRVELQDADTGALVLLDITASEAPAEDKLEPLRIVLTKPVEGSGELQSQRESAKDAEHSTSIPTPSAVLLTRYAAQSLYAPLRTIEPVAGIIPTPIRATLDLTTLVPTLPVNVTMLAAWRLQDQWVSALRITNLSATWQQLDPRTLQGDFLAATFQHRQLGPHGDSTDTTVLYLVTRGHGLAESLLPALSPVDAATNLSAPTASEPTHEK